MTDNFVYIFLRDQGSLISGLLALGAGLLAYQAGHVQAEVARQQIAQTRRIEARRLARESWAATSALIAVLESVARDLKEMREALKGGVDSSFNSRFDFPTLSLLWPTLASVEREAMRQFIDFEKASRQYVERGPITLDAHRTAVDKLCVQADALIEELNSETGKVLKVLRETEDTKPPSPAPVSDA